MVSRENIFALRMLQTLTFGKQGGAISDERSSETELSGGDNA